MRHFNSAAVVSCPLQRALAQRSLFQGDPREVAPSSTAASQNAERSPTPVTVAGLPVDRSTLLRFAARRKSQGPSPAALCPCNSSAESSWMSAMHCLAVLHAQNAVTATYDALLHRLQRHALSTSQWGAALHTVSWLRSRPSHRDQEALSHKQAPQLEKLWKGLMRESARGVGGRWEEVLRLLDESNDRPSRLIRQLGVLHNGIGSQWRVALGSIVLPSLSFACESAGSLNADASPSTIVEQTFDDDCFVPIPTAATTFHSRCRVLIHRLRSWHTLTIRNSDATPVLAELTACLAEIHLLLSTADVQHEWMQCLWEAHSVGSVEHSSPFVCALECCLAHVTSPSSAMISAQLRALADVILLEHCTRIPVMRRNLLWALFGSTRHSTLTTHLYHFFEGKLANMSDPPAVNSVVSICDLSLAAVMYAPRRGALRPNFTRIALMCLGNGLVKPTSQRARARIFECWMKTVCANGNAELRGRLCEEYVAATRGDSLSSLFSGGRESRPPNTSLVQLIESLWVTAGECGVSIRMAAPLLLPRERLLVSFQALKLLSELDGKMVEQLAKPARASEGGTSTLQRIAIAVSEPTEGLKSCDESVVLNCCLRLLRGARDFGLSSGCRSCLVRLAASLTEWAAQSHSSAAVSEALHHDLCLIVMELFAEFHKKELGTVNLLMGPVVAVLSHSKVSREERAEFFSRLLKDLPRNSSADTQSAMKAAARKSMEPSAAISGASDEWSWDSASDAIGPDPANGASIITNTTTNGFFDLTTDYALAEAQHRRMKHGVLNRKRRM